MYECICLKGCIFVPSALITSTYVVPPTTVHSMSNEIHKVHNRLANQLATPVWKFKHLATCAFIMDLPGAVTTKTHIGTMLRWFACLRECVMAMNPDMVSTSNNWRACMWCPNLECSFKCIGATNRSDQKVLTVKKWYGIFFTLPCICIIPS
jgi:hypothetical protein